MNEGKLINVSHSTVSAKDKNLTNTHLRQKWNNINRHLLEKSVNKLQVRITKAVKQNKWHHVKFREGDAGDRFFLSDANTSTK